MVWVMVVFCVLRVTPIVRRPARYGQPDQSIELPTRCLIASGKRLEDSLRPAQKADGVASDPTP